MNGVSDWDLVARARAGDAQAFADLVRRYQTPIIQFCYRMVGVIPDAEDLAQESFVRVYRHLHRLRPDAKFSTLLFGIARNLTLNFLRDSKRRGRGVTQRVEATADLPDNTRRPDETARLQEIEAMILRAMELLSPDHREILILRELNGMDYDSIAAVIGCRKGTVKSRLARAREQLREHMTSLGGDLL